MQCCECKWLYGCVGVCGVVLCYVVIYDFDSVMLCEFGDLLLILWCFEVDDILFYFCMGGIMGLLKIVICWYGNEVVNVWSVGQVVGVGMGLGKIVFCGLLLFYVNVVLVIGLVLFLCGVYVVLGMLQGYCGDGVVK